MTKRKDKKERLKKLYLLEYMVMSGDRSEKVEELRVELKCKEEEYVHKGKPKGAKNFDIKIYEQYKLENPNLTDNEVAADLGVSPQTIARLKRKNGLCKKQNSSNMRLKRMEQIMDMLKKDPTLTKKEIADVFGISSALVSKDLNDYEEWKCRFGKVN